MEPQYRQMYGEISILKEGQLMGAFSEHPLSLEPWERKTLTTFDTED